MHMCIVYVYTIYPGNVRIHIKLIVVLINVIGKKMKWASKIKTIPK
jgi:hypothetical protein